MIHGHIHNNCHEDFWELLVKRPLVLNAGVDINGFVPVTLPELIENNEVFKQLHPVRENNRAYDEDSGEDAGKEKIPGRRILARQAKCSISYMIMEECILSITEALLLIKCSMKDCSQWMTRSITQSLQEMWEMKS